MRSSSLPALTRRARNVRRRTRRRATIVTASLAVGLLATAGATVTSPLAAAEASAPAGGFALASFTTPLEPVAVVEPAGTDEISTGAREALAGADTAIAAAADVTADVKAAGLDLGDIATTVDTSDLGEATERLSGGLDLPAPLVPDLTDDVTELTDAVEADTAELRAALVAAEKLKAEQEAAAKAKREAEARAAAEAAEAQQSSGGGGGAMPAVSGGGASAAEAQSIAQGMLASYGWGGDQFSCLVSLWNKESGWNYPGLQLLERCVRHSSGAPRQQDGQRRRRLADECRDADPLGPGIHLGSLRLAVRCLVALAVGRLVLTLRENE
jgi:hypothetical protein